MKSSELAKDLMKYPGFEVNFTFCDGYSTFPNYRKFEKIKVQDIGHSDKIISLGGEEI